MFQHSFGRGFWTLVLVLCSCFSGWCQTEAYVQYHQQGVAARQRGDLSVALQQMGWAMEEARLHQDTLRWIHALDQQVYLYRMTGDYTEAVALARSGMNLLALFPNERLQQRLPLQYVNSLLGAGQYGRAHEVLDTLRQAWSAPVASATRAQWLALKGSLYYRQGDYIPGRVHYDSALRYYAEERDGQAQANVHYNLGLLHFQLSDYPTSLSYYLAALHYFDSVGQAGLVAQVYNGMGALFEKQADETLALRYLEAGLLEEAVDGFEK